MPLRRPSSRRAASSARRSIDEINGLADLVALDRAAAHRERTLVLGADVDAAGDRLAIVRSALPRPWRPC